MKKLLLVVLLFTSSAHADSEHDGEKFYEQCKEALDVIDRLEAGEESPSNMALHSCTSYIEGFRDAWRIFAVEDENPYCVPRGVTNAELARVIVDFLEQNPEGITKYSKMGMVIYAFMDRYRCFNE